MTYPSKFTVEVPFILNITVLYKFYLQQVENGKGGNNGKARQIQQPR